MTFLLTCYFILKGKYMINYEEWDLNQQVVLSDEQELKHPLNFKDF